MWWDERAPGGHAKAWLFLLHPGPSLLVTATFVLVAGIARRSLPDASLSLRLALVMLPIQFSIGVMNDVCDVADDARSKPYKPIVRGVVRRQTALVIGLVLAALGLVVSVTINWPTAGLTAAGLAAGLLYDVGLRSTPVSLLPWWLGMTSLPLAAYAADGLLRAPVLGVMPLALLAALGLHCANALPDIESDRAAGRRSLPVLLGVRTSGTVALAAIAAAGAVALVLMVPLRQTGALVPVAAGVLAVLLLAVAVARPARPFPALAIGVAAFAVCWLAALPV